MKSYTAKTATPEAIVEELLNGGGAVKISGLFSADQIAEARANLKSHLCSDT